RDVDVRHVAGVRTRLGAEAVAGIAWIVVATGGLEGWLALAGLVDVERERTLRQVLQLRYDEGAFLHLRQFNGADRLALGVLHRRARHGALFGGRGGREREAERRGRGTGERQERPGQAALVVPAAGDGGARAGSERGHAV